MYEIEEKTYIFSKDMFLLFLNQIVLFNYTSTAVVTMLADVRKCLTTHIKYFKKYNIIYSKIL